MKRIVILTALMLMLVCEGATAQIKFGVKGGLNFTNFTSARQSIKLHNSTGWHAGVLSQITVPVVGLGIQPELLYSVAQADEGSIGYVQIPINVRYQIIPGRIRAIVLAGPHLGYASNFSGSFDSDHNKSWDWGFGLGAGVEFRQFQLTGKYSWGLLNISKNSDANLRNSAFALSLAYIL